MFPLSHQYQITFINYPWRYSWDYCCSRGGIKQRMRERTLAVKDKKTRVDWVSNLRRSKRHTSADDALTHWAATSLLYMYGTLIYTVFRLKKTTEMLFSPWTHKRPAFLFAHTPSQKNARRSFDQGKYHHLWNKNKARLIGTLTDVIVRSGLFF